MTRTTASARLADALLALARGQELSPAQRQELVDSGWGDATQQDARRELEEQARRQVAR